MEAIRGLIIGYFILYIIDKFIYQINPVYMGFLALLVLLSSIIMAIINKIRMDKDKKANEDP